MLDAHPAVSSGLLRGLILQSFSTHIYSWYLLRTAWLEAKPCQPGARKQHNHTHTNKLTVKLLAAPHVASCSTCCTHICTAELLPTFQLQTQQQLQQATAVQCSGTPASSHTSTLCTHAVHLAHPTPYTCCTPPTSRTNTALLCRSRMYRYPAYTHPMAIFLSPPSAPSYRHPDTPPQHAAPCGCAAL